MPIPTIKTDIAAKVLKSTMSTPTPAAPATATPPQSDRVEEKAQRRKKFEDAFQVIRNELLEHFAAQGMPEDAVDWYRRVSGDANHLVSLSQ